MEYECLMDDNEILEMLAEEYPEFSEEQLKYELEMLKIIWEEEQLTPQQRSEQMKIEYFRENLSPTAKTWGLWQACFLLLDTDDKDEGLEFLCMYFLRLVRPQHNFPLFETYLWKLGYYINVRRYVEEAIADSRYELVLEKPYIRPNDFLAWAERAGYRHRIPEDVYNNVTGANHSQECDLGAQDNQPPAQDDLSRATDRGKALLTRKERLVLDTLLALPENEGRTAKQIADAVLERTCQVLLETSIKNHLIKSLRGKGYDIVNRPGIGYFLRKNETFRQPNRRD